MLRKMIQMTLIGLAGICFGTQVFAFAPTYTYEYVDADNRGACFANYPSGFREEVNIGYCRDRAPRYSYEFFGDGITCVASYASGLREKMRIEYCRYGAEYSYREFGDEQVLQCVAIYLSGLQEPARIEYCRGGAVTYRYEIFGNDDMPSCVAYYKSGLSEVVNIAYCRN